jgi:hypothetical protein
MGTKPQTDQREFMHGEQTVDKVSVGGVLFRLDIDTWRVVWHEVDCELCRDVIKASVLSGCFDIWFPSKHAEKILSVIGANDWVHEFDDPS